MEDLANYQSLSLKEFIPLSVKRSDSGGTPYELVRKENVNSFDLHYMMKLHNQTGFLGMRPYRCTIPKFITRNEETFEVLGLLQAEMGKQNDGKVNFSNHEPEIINKVIDWFERELKFPKDRWKWYIKVNINRPEDENYRKQIEEKMISNWVKQCSLSLESAYPVRVSYISKTKHKLLKDNDFGTLIIEKRQNIFCQIVKKLVKDLTNSIHIFGQTEIRAYMRGIIAGEANVEINYQFCHFRVFITAKDPEERKIFQRCLCILGIESTYYENFLAIIISKRDNLRKLLHQGLMSGSPEKEKRFGLIHTFYKGGL